MCHVIEEGDGILIFKLLFNYIITNKTLTCVTWAFVVHHKIKLFDVHAMCMVSKYWNYWFIEILTYGIVQHGHLRYKLVWHMASYYLKIIQHMWNRTKVNPNALIAHIKK
jgi:hypothetical protein